MKTKKIDIYVDSRYVCSTNRYTRCKDAVASYKQANNDDAMVKAYFDHGYNK
jgi:hypothetical protein